MTAWDPYDIDEDTGLPRVPKGYFWRVARTEGVFYDLPPQVHLRKKVLGLFSRTVDACWISDDYLGSVSDMKFGIQESATTIVCAMRKDEQARAVDRAVDHLYGDYPPKKLNN